MAAAAAVAALHEERGTVRRWIRRTTTSPKDLPGLAEAKALQLGWTAEHVAEAAAEEDSAAEAAATARTEATEAEAAATG
jgi:hypothetical protein